MKRIVLFLAALLVATQVPAAEDLTALATQAVSSDPALARSAQDQLRAAGPAGLEALTAQFAPQIATHRQGAPSDDPWKKIAAALNHVSAQYDDYASGLYWYTDLEKAKAASGATGRPILSLRLLGNLDTDLSCANSRFFRTTLYPNSDIGKLLRERFILHWASVRPVPVVTIDFGDGRQLTRTVTGNSIHYILDSQGRVVDALPGLYRPSAFLSELRQIADALAALPHPDAAAYAAYRTATSQRLRVAWADDLEKISKAFAFGQEPSVARLKSLTTDQTWEAISHLPSNQAQLDDSSLRLIANKMPSAVTAAPIAVSKCVVEAPLVRSLRLLKDHIALDSVRNNYQYRAEILDHLDSLRTPSLPEINNWVYTTIFLTPPSDPWLGLAPVDAFAAIDQDGKVQPALASSFPAAPRMELRSEPATIPLK
ncbi:hypothetical protein BH09VER1_BH09VER1_07860 [soil metagenome]